ncbi:unnamed protein product [Prorocentrum cordatum]|uniref:Endonuclease/exonuclease/phosphatase domain-containing protein n=1 Tax=Prorocentrum cordatum TaxID=2364126 RepID=A0ABN9RCH6_9DINO|nr:unnamed protein product [Polarella glacialis]
MHHLRRLPQRSEGLEDGGGGSCQRGRARGLTLDPKGSSRPANPASSPPHQFWPSRRSIEDKVQRQQPVTETSARQMAFPCSALPCAILAALAAQAWGTAVTVATWNVASIDWASAEQLSQQILGFNADVVLTQEDVEFEPQHSSNGISLEGYRRAGACRAEPLWDTMSAYALGGRYLQNAVYVRESTIRVVRSFSQSLSDTSPNPRCAAYVDFVPADAPFGEADSYVEPFRVASVHLTGGFYVDGSWRNFTVEKPKQARSVLSWQPDIAAGDLNSFSVAAQVAESQGSYSPFVEAQSAGDVDEYIGFQTGGVDEFLRGGMYRVPADGATSRWGGTVDHVFLRNSARVGWAAGQSSTVGTFSSSDHAAVVATVELSWGAASPTGGSTQELPEARIAMIVSCVALSLIVLVVGAALWHYVVRRRAASTEREQGPVVGQQATDGEVDIEK